MDALRIWWIPQVPGPMFTVPVGSLREAKLLLDTLADYDAFQLEHRIKPDYCNAGGLQEFAPLDDEDGPEGSWVDWHDPEDDRSIEDLTMAECEELDQQRA